MKQTILAIAIGGAVAAGAPVWAHHSHAMFDTSKVETVTGTVKAYDYANPHIHIYMMVKDKTDTFVLYTVEGPPPPLMGRQGVGPTTFKPGDMVSVRVNPLRDGKLGGYFLGAIDAQGTRYGELAPNHGHRAATGPVD